MRLKPIKDWFVKHLETIFSVLGFIGTLYFGIWYVPSWFRETQNEKLNRAQSEILQSTKELVFSDSTFSLAELNFLFRAKEITVNQKLPLTVYDVLTKTQESFMEDKFLPLTKRRELIREIEEIKNKLSQKHEPLTKSEKAGDNALFWVSLMSGLVAVIAVSLGLLSIIVRYRAAKDKEEEIKNEIQEGNAEPINNQKEIGHEFEYRILEVLRSRNDLEIYDQTENSKYGIDFVVSRGRKKYFIEVKYLTKSKVGLKTFYRFTSYLEGKIGEAWLIYNTDLTPLVVKQIENYNRENRRITIKAIRVTDPLDFQRELEELIPEQTTIPFNYRWVLNHWGSSTAVIINDRVFFHGKTTPDPRGDGCHIDLDGILEIGTIYEISCFAKAVEGTNAKVQLWCNDDTNTGSNPKVEVKSEYVLPSSDWEKISVEFPAISKNIRIHLHYLPGLGGIEVTDVLITKLPNRDAFKEHYVLH